MRTAMNGAAVCALNAELGVAMDEPAAVARELLALLRGSARERLLGMPERLFARLNQLVPGPRGPRAAPTASDHPPARAGLEGGSSR